MREAVEVGRLVERGAMAAMGDFAREITRNGGRAAIPSLDQTMLFQ